MNERNASTIQSMIQVLTPEQRQQLELDEIEFINNIFPAIASIQL